jgi:hypothetical protein
MINKTHICPGCLFLGRVRAVKEYSGVFICYFCQDGLNKTTNIKYQTFYKTFLKHFKRGSHCADCKRFIPLSTNDIVVCPYLDCSFAGEQFLLSPMRHPSKLISEIDDGELQTPILFDIKTKILLQTIKEQINLCYYKPQINNIKHKLFALQSIQKVLLQEPDRMSKYLLENSRSGGFQHKIFQTYINLWENNLPMILMKNSNYINVKDITDSVLNLFEGVSFFEGVVLENLTIKNNTKEFYVGGRKSTIAAPYYIGKLLNISDGKNSLLKNVIEYSFSKIQLQGVVPGTIVKVSHLRIPPHYQMGGMSYLNRARKIVVEQAKLAQANAS